MPASRVSRNPKPETVRKGSLKIELRNPAACTLPIPQREARQSAKGRAAAVGASGPRGPEEEHHPLLGHLREFLEQAPEDESTARLRICLKFKYLDSR